MTNIIVIKCGGSMVSDVPESFYSNIQELKSNGLKPVIVHGGGPAIQEMLDKLSIKSNFVDGLRVTPDETIDIVEMVLTGKVNNDVTLRFNKAGIPSIGLSGSDAGLLTAKAKDYERYGYVGDIVHVNTQLITKLLDQQIVPIIAPIAIGKNGKKYNVNADTVAGVIANHLLAKQLVFITDVPGIMNDNQLIESTSTTEIEQWIKEGIIYGGMIPKVRAAMDSLNGGMEEVVISNGEKIFTNKSEGIVGTIVKKSVGVVKGDGIVSNI